MERSYYALWYRLDNADAFLLWYSDDVDGVVIDEQGRVLSFCDLGTLQRWVHAQGWEVDTNKTVLYDFDAIQQWCEGPSTDTVDCVTLLNTWNLFMDVRASVERRNVLKDDPENNDFYDKLFFGNNLPSITPPGEHYIPAWSEEEIERLSRILAAGLRLFRERVRPVGAT